MTISDSVCIITALNLALYLKTLRYKFVSDDLTVFYHPPVFKNQLHRRWLQFIGACKLQGKTLRFFKNQQGKWEMAVIETEEQEHLLAVLLHTAICLTIYFAFGASSVSFLTALLYSTNPINHQATIWPGGRGYVLPILSLLLSICVPFLSPALLYFCSWFTIGFLAPLVLIGSTKWYLLGWMPLVWFLHWLKFSTAIKLKASKESFDEDRKYTLKKLRIYVKTYGFYFLLCLFPFRITFYHNFLQSMAGNDIMMRRAYAFDRYFLTGIVAFFGIIIYSCFCWGPIAWALVAFTIGIIPFCNIVRSNQEIAERFCALPNVFLMYALAQIIFKIGEIKS